MKQEREPTNIKQVPAKIVLIEGREAIVAKAVEYRKRLTNPNLTPQSQLKETYKALITEELASTGTVDTTALTQRIQVQDGSIDMVLFGKACRIIEDYVTTGGKNLEGGTGLPKIKPTDIDWHNL
ncbi:hypothetical protein A3G53_01510 [Candidatus Nomurabacteria bacterium RIFCSPLOWO2_12_FULL_44_11]|uniref:Uncharacterized protein n=1 Tax=Candidatus Nomurabacteria bacterium RIFCSPLOWO2_12_FULL_44_11 TaxID=1801796 RepID=A0A1F6Y6J7_9BACT|nr:MAG: hypothetical protein A3G53_01510 [Candidatus Nomurabacteria bacterium RIFCSPLOWO2_12_FULL_44_11]